jgi:hypothetical protein
VSDFGHQPMYEAGVRFANVVYLIDTARRALQKSKIEYDRISEDDPGADENWAEFEALAKALEAFADIPPFEVEIGGRRWIRLDQAPWPGESDE